MGFALRRPGTVRAAVAAVAAAPAGSLAVLAGGTDLLPDIDRGRAQPAELLSLARLPWRRHTWTGTSLAIGATQTLRALELDPQVRRRLPGLYEALRAVGGVALRERATVGGNVARSAPASDLLPILLAYDARVELVGPDGSRSVPLDAFLAEPRRPGLRRGELIATVVVPRAGDSEYRWQRVRPANDVSQVGIAIVRSLTRPHWRVALGGVPPRATRLRGVEARLADLNPSDAEVELAAQTAAVDAPFVTDPRASESYRRRIVTVLVRRAVAALRERAASSEARG